MFLHEPRRQADHLAIALDRERRREAAYRRHRPLVWWATLVGPVIYSTVILGFLALTRGWPSVVTTIGTAIASLFFGKFIILGGASDSIVLLSAEELTLMVISMDMMTASWFVYHFGLMLRLPALGPRFALLMDDSQYVMSTNPWLRHTAFLGLVIFVMIPFAMTGSVGGSILARLLGMSRPMTFLAIFLGSCLGSGLMYFGAELLGPILSRDNPLWSIGGIVIMIALILLVNSRYNHAKARALGELPHSQSARENV